MSTSIYIAPSVLDEDISGRRSIYMCKNFADTNVHAEFRRHPRNWVFVGETDSAGRIVTLDRVAIGDDLYQDLMESQPLTAGTMFRSDTKDEAAVKLITQARAAAARNEGALIAVPQANAWPAVYSVQPQHLPRADNPQSLQWPAQFGQMVAHFHQGQWFKPGGWVQITNPQVLEALNCVQEVKFDFSVRASVHAKAESPATGHSVRKVMPDQPEQAPRRMRP